MKIVSWNCNGAFRKKYQEIIKFEADIYIIQECENPEYTKCDYGKWASNYHWIGDSKNKGLGIFARPEIKIRKLDWDDLKLKLFLPINVADKFNLIGVWTKHADSPTFCYIGQLWKYLNLHKNKMAESDTILCGDLNSNKIWDVWDRWWNHSDVVNELQKINMYSLYHFFTKEEQGAESIPTFFHRKDLNKPYHIDFAFSKDNLFSHGTNFFGIGEKNKWIEFSDHLPIYFTITC